MGREAAENVDYLRQICGRGCMWYKEWRKWQRNMVL